MRSLLRIFRKPAILVVSVMLGLALVACSPADSSDAVRVGVLLPLSGKYADTGKTTLDGIRFAVDQHNDKASGNGRRVELVVADNGGDPQKAVTEARRLISQEGVVFILGPYSTPECQAVSRTVGREKVGALGPQTGIRPDTPYFHILGMTYDQWAKAYLDFIDFIGKWRPVHTVAITYPENDYGVDVSNFLAEGLTRKGVKVVGRFSFPPAATDLTSTLLKVRDSSPDAVVSVSYLEDGVKLFQARHRLRYNSPLWIGGSAGFTDDRLWTMLGDPVARETLAPSFGLAFYDSQANLPGLRRLLDEVHRQDPKKVVEQGFITGTQSAYVLLRALDAAGGTDAEAVNRAVANVSIEPGSSELVLPMFSTGLSFDNGIPVDPQPLFVQWADGGKKIVFPAGQANAQPRIEGK